MKSKFGSLQKMKINGAGTGERLHHGKVNPQIKKKITEQFLRKLTLKYFLPISPMLKKILKNGQVQPSTCMSRTSSSDSMKMALVLEKDIIMEESMLKFKNYIRAGDCRRATQ